jgi:hypothetical protein
MQLAVITILLHKIRRPWNAKEHPRSFLLLTLPLYVRVPMHWLGQYRVSLSHASREKFIWCAYCYRGKYTVRANRFRLSYPNLISGCQIVFGIACLGVIRIKRVLMESADSTRQRCRCSESSVALGIAGKMSSAARFRSLQQVSGVIASARRLRAKK